ncbi:YD repeat-containing protein [Pseudomonas cichorii]|uniref:YD repeat-containing protein n=1 Tax=Pseudomonas cichorii TaxID=36746 RepID=A0A3M4M237_PSECI|nr:RHS repeat-associated core domain-containing protein [Pseudomonas cichorii]RMQ47354.1 YD repeat-containing protein [Pseudomonas cichorii]
MSHTLHARTPTISVVDGRSLTVRNVAYHRIQDQDEPLALITRMAYDSAGRLTTQWDPRLWALAEHDAASPANLVHRHNLAGIPLLSESVDAGWDLVLRTEAGNVVQRWDARGSVWQTRYDLNLRPVTMLEIDARQNARTIMRSVYADNSQNAIEHNQCGRLLRLDDTAGSLHFPEYGILGQILNQSRQFLKTPDLPDWAENTDYLDLVESEELITQWQYNAVGESILQTDAMGHTQHFKQTIAGQLKTVELALSGATPQTLVSEIRYNPFDQIEQETAGNGVVSQSLYDPQDERLMERSTSLFQNLKYAYDPVGNILQIEDAAQPVRFFANQRIEPISHYRYDTLYQLIEATGREVNTGTSHGPALPDLQNLPPDPNQVSNYTQNYDYDAGGNLLQMRHVGAQSFTRTMRVALDSNRSLSEGETDADFESGFDANGNLLQLVRSQALEWDLRNQLQQITTVTRATKASDHERYIYDGQGLRCRKINSAQASNHTLVGDVRYLPGLEIRTRADGEILHVITTHNVRALHWQAGLPNGITNDQIRYNLNDHLGSSTLELDQQGSLISQESYYPFGGTAWWAARSAVEAKYKTVRYSGKERDASGLYYYGFRYYAPWLQRWINPDPAGDINGLNLFCFVANTPLLHKDLEGMSYEGRGDDIERGFEAIGHTILYRGLDEFRKDQKAILKKAFIKTHQIYEGALYMMKYHPEENTDIMRSFFGYHHAEVTQQVIQSWEQSYLRAAEYRTPLGESKILGVRTVAPNLFAFTSQKDPHGRIAIDTRHINNKRITLTIGHELSHLKKVSGSTIYGPNSEDYYYLFGQWASALVGGGNIINYPPTRVAAEVITGGGLNSSYFSGFERLAAIFTNRVRALHPHQETVTDLNTAIIEFNRNPSIAAKISADNADSLIYSAYALYKRYKQKNLQSLNHQQRKSSQS